MSGFAERAIEVIRDAGGDSEYACFVEHAARRAPARGDTVTAQPGGAVGMGQDGPVCAFGPGVVLGRVDDPEDRDVATD